MKYFVDGNNLGLFLFSEKRDEDVRSKVLNFLLKRKIPNGTIVVFDGFGTLAENEKGKLMVVFSKKRKADEVIIQKISKDDIVVTNDRELQIKCRLKRAKVCDLSTFISKIEIKTKDNEKPLKENDIEGWMKIFSKDDGR